MEAVIYKNTKKWFDELELLMKKHHISSEEYRIIGLPHKLDESKTELYIMNSYIVVSPKGCGVFSRHLREYEIQDIIRAGTDFIETVVRDKKKQRRMIYEFLEWDNWDMKMSDPLHAFTIEESDAKKMHVVPYFNSGHDYGNSYWICPVILPESGLIGSVMGVVKEVDEEISIPAEFAEALLYPVFVEYFDEDLDANKKRVDHMEMTDEHEAKPVLVKRFDNCLTYNFYTYESVGMLLDKIAEYADSLDHGNLESIDLKTRQGIETLYDGDDEKAWNSYCRWTAAFYRRLVHVITEMMTNHPETGIMSIMGP